MSSRAKLIVIALASVLFGVLVILHTPWLNGPRFWSWSWRRVDPLVVYGGMAIAAIPFFIGQAMYRGTSWGRSIALALAMVSCFLMRLVSVMPHTSPPSLLFVSVIVENPDATSYYTDAVPLSTLPLRQWLPAYAQIMPGLHLHSQSKPPGPILYWIALIKLLGVGPSTAFAGGLILGAIGTLAIPATFLLLRQMSGEADAAAVGAAFLALCPGFVLFFPMFDPAYILLSAGLIGFWLAALRRNSHLLAGALGATLALTCLVTFNVLVIGLFTVGMAFVIGKGSIGKRLVRAASLGGTAFTVAVLLLVILWVACGYDPIATFASAWRNQHELLRHFASQRPYPATIPFDLSDLALGTGWIGIILLAFYLARRPAQRTEAERRAYPLVVLGLAQLAAVAALGLLQLETARVWNFMFPLLMLPVGLELSRWPKPARAVAYAGLLFITAAICQNLKLIY